MNRRLDRSKVDDMEKSKAWKLVQAAADDKDMADFKKVSMSSLFILSH